MHLFRDTHPRLRTTNTLWQIAHTFARDSIDDSAAHIERLVSHLGSPKMDFGLRDLRQARSLHLLGGGYVNSIWGNNLNIVAAMTAVKRSFGVPIYATGQGLLPHDEASRTWMNAQLAEFDYIEARDVRSASTFGIRHGSDDAFLAFANDRPIYAPRERQDSSMILVQGDMLDSAVEADLAGLVDEFVDAAGGAKDVGFAEGIPPEDSMFAQAHLRDGADFYPFMRIWDEGFPAFAGQEWLTSRFHFHLLAAAAGARGTVVSVLPGYYDVKHEMLLEIGTGWRLHDGQPGHDTHSGSVDPAFPSRARKLGAEKAQLAATLYAR